jgi:hypothetical protein
MDGVGFLPARPAPSRPCYTPLSMPETETAPASVHSEHTLTPREAEELHAIEQETLPCPTCSTPDYPQPLTGQKIIAPGVYEGVIFICFLCGFSELG